MCPNLFAYGSLCREEVVRRLLGRVPKKVGAKLRGYARRELLAFPYPFVVEERGSKVEGVLYLGVSENELEKLDWYEDVEEGLYARKAVLVESEEELVSAYVYVAGPKLLALLKRRS